MCLRHLGILGLVASLFACSASAALVGPELWWYDSTNMQVPANVDILKARMDTAAAAGYTGVVLSDFKMSLVDWPSWYLSGLNQVKAYAAQKGLKITVASFPFGYSEAILHYDKNLAEGIQVKDAAFHVATDGKSLLFDPRTPTTTNLGFDAGSGTTNITGWSLDPSRALRDTTVKRTGTASLKIAAYPGGGSTAHRAYGIETLTVLPYEQLHVSFYVKTQNFSGDLHVKLYDSTKGLQRDFTWDDLPNQAATQDWTKYDLVFNTNNSTSIQLRLGSWYDTSGTAWFDDVAVEEVPLHNLVKTPTGSPLTIRRANGTLLTEGTDVNTITDPNGFVNGAFSAYHLPPTVTINPATSGLRAGDPVKIDYVAVPGPIGNYETGASLIEPNMWNYVDRIHADIRANFPAGTGLMMGYDEMRQMNTSPGEKALGLTAGQLLAQNASQLIAKLHASGSGDPSAPLFTWSDMFDPNHNAVNNYYYVDGTIGASGTIPGSWAGLTRDVTIMNWMRTKASLQFFANLGNPQIISGYYDGGNGTTAATNELATAGTIAGIRGLMYTTWQGDYSQMVAYANAAKAAWHWRIPGDANLDGIVDQADYTAWYNNYSTGSMWEQGDFNGDARVDQADYTAWYNNYGSTGGNVPEPATLTLLAVAAMAVLRRRVPVRTSPGRADQAARW